MSSGIVIPLSASQMFPCLLAANLGDRSRTLSQCGMFEATEPLICAVDRSFVCLQPQHSGVMTSRKPLYHLFGLVSSLITTLSHNTRPAIGNHGTCPSFGHLPRFCPHASRPARPSTNLLARDGDQTITITQTFTPIAPSRASFANPQGMQRLGWRTSTGRQGLRSDVLGQQTSTPLSCSVAEYTVTRYSSPTAIVSLTWSGPDLQLTPSLRS